jgi:hypothetical protein
MARRSTKSDGHLVVCPRCGRHARIVSSKGQGPIFFSKWTGRATVFVARFWGFIRGEDCERLIGVIDSSVLPDRSLPATRELEASLANQDLAQRLQGLSDTDAIACHVVSPTIH